MGDCVTRADVCIIRGSEWALDVGISNDWTEVIADPGGYIGTIVLREEQDDQLPSNLTLTAVPRAISNPAPGAPPLYMEFSATAQQTQQLPPYDIVGYCEIAPLSNPAGNRRLFNMRVDIHD